MSSGNNYGSTSDLESHDSWSTNDGSIVGREVGNGVTVTPGKTSDPGSNRRSGSRQLISRPPSTVLSRSPVPSADARNPREQYHQLEEEFGRRYQEYLSLNDWMDKRLAVFTELCNQLSASTAHAPDQQIVFRLVIEEKRLKEDAAYGEKLERLEEACAALMMIKARVREIVEQQCPRSSNNTAKTSQWAL